MKMISALVLSIFTAIGTPFDKFDENGSAIKNLTQYIEYEYAGIKKAIDKDYSFNFNWKFCSMATFPMILGRSCPYFSDREKYRSIQWKGSTAYVQDENHIYVGIKYWFSTKQGIPSDTTFYQVISYKFIEPSSWIRDKEIINIRTKLDVILQITEK
jgi:hypothetical protein